VIIPIINIVTRIPAENKDDNKNARFVVMLPCPFIKPIINGMLAKWHGLRIILKIPQINEPDSAMAGEESRVFDSNVNKSSNIILFLVVSILQ
jgi:hypothetical protein